MKKIIVVFAAAVLAAGISACGTGLQGKNVTTEVEKTFEQLLAENQPLTFTGESGPRPVNDPDDDDLINEFFMFVFYPADKRLVYTRDYALKSTGYKLENDIQTRDGTFEIKGKKLIHHVTKITDIGEPPKPRDYLVDYEYEYRNNELTLKYIDETYGRTYNLKRQ